MTAQLSREIIENLLQHNDESDSPANAEAWEVNALCRLALAGMDSEPVAVIDKEGSPMTRAECNDDRVFAICCKVGTPLYAAPPAPAAVHDGVINKQVFKDTFDRIVDERDSDIEIGQLGCSNYEALVDAAYDAACRAAMLQGEENSVPLTTIQPAPELDSSPKNDKSHSGSYPAAPDFDEWSRGCDLSLTLCYSDFREQAKYIWSSACAAMLKAGHVTGWIKCSERMPPENDQDIWLWNGSVQSGYIWNGDRFVDWNEEYQELRGVTHWMPMPLPAAPEQEV